MTDEQIRVQYHFRNEKTLLNGLDVSLCEDKLDDPLDEWLLDRLRRSFWGEKYEEYFGKK